MYKTDDASLLQLAQDTARALQATHGLLATAESCTGGWVAKLMTDIAGSSKWFERGFVTYTNQAKQDMLGVEAGVLQQYGAVSEQTVRQMASGALQHSRARLSLAVSGIAGPGGGSVEKPVGLVWFAWAATVPNQPRVIKTDRQIFAGNRDEVRRQAVANSLQGLLLLIDRM